jgi:hypothetical protein
VTASEPDVALISLFLKVFLPQIPIWTPQVYSSLEPEASNTTSTPTTLCFGQTASTRSSWSCLPPPSVFW